MIINQISKTYTIQYSEKNAFSRIWNEVYNDNVYLKFYPKMVVVDVGACIGYFTLKVAPFATKIFAIEPLLENYNNLIENVKNNGITANVYNLALSDKNGTAYLHTHNVYEDCQLNNDSSGQAVETMTLASFMTKHLIDHIDLLKVDTEGSEYQIFGAPDFKDVADKIDYITVEFHGGPKDILEKFGFKQIGVNGIVYSYGREAWLR